MFFFKKFLKKFIQIQKHFLYFIIFYAAFIFIDFILFYLFRANHIEKIEIFNLEIQKIEKNRKKSKSKIFDFRRTSMGNRIKSLNIFIILLKYFI